jgi:hypothetical protein
MKIKNMEIFENIPEFSQDPFVSAVINGYLFDIPYFVIKIRSIHKCFEIFVSENRIFVPSG